jgi:hypothetical protein
MPIDIERGLTAVQTAYVLERKNDERLSQATPLHLATP